MVAQNIALPNLRKLFIPDPGYLSAECDLSGADAQVVAWEADDADLKAAFRAGLKLHIKNSRDLFPEKTKDLTDAELKAQDHPGGIYHDIKRAVHGTNYGGSAWALATIIKWPVSRAEEFQERWFFLHPGIKEWHRRTERWLNGSQCWRCNTLVTEALPRCTKCNASLGRTVRNAFGYRRIYFDRIDGLLPEALAWVPQSTVAINTERGMLLVEETYPFLQILLQVHDSIVFQIPKSYRHILPDIQSTLNTVITPYPDPLQIPWGLASSDKSWGDCV